MAEKKPDKGWDALVEEVNDLKTGLNDFVGTTGDDKIKGTVGDDFIAGESGVDRLRGGEGDDLMLGGGGDDVILGQAGDDVMFGASSTGGAVDMSKFRIAEDYEATVTFDYESAGYKNILGMYKIGADGSIRDVEVLFENASLKGSGGDLISGESSVTTKLQAGDTLGFFVVPNGFSRNGATRDSDGIQGVLKDSATTYRFVDQDGNPASMDSTSELTLVATDANGAEYEVQSQYGDSVFHSVMGDNKAFNVDGMDHVKAYADTKEGTVKIGFEDLKNGGDKDFDDSVFTIDLGVTNTALLPRPQTSSGTSTDDDLMKGGIGDDVMFGMRGDDVVKGGKGDDKLWGNSGNDELYGGAGNDELRAGSGDDYVKGGAGDDVIDGNSGDDAIVAGSGNDDVKGSSGNDKISDGAGNDKVSGGSGDDYFLAGSGDDLYVGGSGFDTLDYSNARGGITADLSKHTVSGRGKDEVWGVEKLIASQKDDTVKGDKRDNVIDGAAGDDVLRGLGGKDTLTGGEGQDTFVWLSKDLVFEGEHLGVDTITDFSFEDGDVLDLSRIIDGKPESIEDFVSLTENERGTLVSVKLGERMVDVVQLEGVFDAAADQLHGEGLILA
ncbi:MAG: DUF4114 domain-containing protein [Pseudomonadota bacterium]